MNLHPIEVTQNVFSHFGNGDVDGIIALLANDIHIQFYGPSAIPYARDYYGLSDARLFFETVLGSVDIHQFEPEQFLSDGDIVTVTGQLHLTARSTGKDIKSDFAHVITVEEGKWVRFRDFMDTAAAVTAFSAPAL